MYGVIIAFKDFNISKGIIGSEWNDFMHFRVMFSMPGFLRVLKNTLIISFLRILFGFPAPIILALLINEIKNTKYKKIVQSVSYLPNFMAWTVLGGIFIALFSITGPINYIITLLGGESIYFLTSTIYFVPILVLTGIWQSIGYSSIIYLAALSSVNMDLYDSADVDGASRLRKALSISLPAIAPLTLILFILTISGILSAGFDQIYNLYNPMVYPVADVIDTYVYRAGIEELRYDFSTAVGLFKNIVGVILIILTNMFAKRVTDSEGIW